MDKIIKITMYLCLCLFVGCVEVEDVEIYTPEVPVTPDVMVTTSTSVTLSSNKKFEYLLIGQEPDLSDALNYNPHDTQYTVSGLQPYTTYYYQAMIRNDVGTELGGEVKSFTTNIELPAPVRSDYYATADNIVSLSAEVPSGTSANILEYGFCISQTTLKPTLETSDAVLIKATGLPSSIDGMSSYSFSGKSDGSQLKKGLITYVRSYIKTDKGVSYSDGNCWFFPVSGIKEDRAYVDLGLPSGTLWTAANFIGKGDLSTLPTSCIYSYEENYYSSDFGSFRMPIYDDAKELYENCTYRNVYINNTNCAMITSNNNGNAIYIPLGGYQNSGGYSYEVGKTGCIWLNSQYNGYWRQLYLSSETGIGYNYYSYHGYKRDIRLVLDD